MSLSDSEGIAVGECDEKESEILRSVDEEESEFRHVVHPKQVSRKDT
jgi:hypothetical protein